VKTKFSLASEFRSLAIAFFAYKACCHYQICVLGKSGKY